MATAREYAERRAKECFADEAASLDRAGFYSTLTGFGSDMKDALDAAKRHHAAGLEWQEQADALAKLPQPSPIPGVIAVDWQEHGPAKKQEPVTVSYSIHGGDDWGFVKDCAPAPNCECALIPAQSLPPSFWQEQVRKVNDALRALLDPPPLPMLIHGHKPRGDSTVSACGADYGTVSATNEGTNCRACEEAIRALSPMPVPKHRMYRVTNEQTWEEP